MQVDSPALATPDIHSRNYHWSSTSHVLIDTMGLPQALEELNTVDLRFSKPAANEPDIQTFASLEGLEVVELEVEVIVL